MRVLDVADDQDRGRLVVRVESVPDLVGCPVCGVVAHAHDRDEVNLVDAPSFGRPVALVWVKRRYVCPEPACEGGTFVKQDDAVATPRALLTTRAVEWAVAQMRREHASVAGLARQLGLAWKTVWRAVRARLEQLAADPARFDGVTMLGVDEHVWHHVDQRKRGPKMLTGMVDLTRDEHGRVRARLLDLVPGRSGIVYGNWLTKRGPAFRAGVEVATLDPFHGYKNAITEHLQDATAVVDAFHVVKLATGCVDDVRRRVQQDTLGHRGRKGDPLYGIRTILRAGIENLTDKQRARLAGAIEARPEHEEVWIAYQVAQDVRAGYVNPTWPLADGQKWTHLARAQRQLSALVSEMDHQVFGSSPRRTQDRYRQVAQGRLGAGHAGLREDDHVHAAGHASCCFGDEFEVAGDITRLETSPRIFHEDGLKLHRASGLAGYVFQESRGGRDGGLQSSDHADSSSGLDGLGRHGAINSEDGDRDLCLLRDVSDRRAGAADDACSSVLKSQECRLDSVCDCSRSVCPGVGQEVFVDDMQGVGGRRDLLQQRLEGGHVNWGGVQEPDGRHDVNRDAFRTAAGPPSPG